jgi:hypothetical protein
VNTTEVRDSWLRSLREDLARAQESKQSQDALLSATARYRGLSTDQRLIVDELFVEQLVSHDEATRFIALALIEDFKISSALPALRRLGDWLEAQPWPGAPYEWAKVNRIIALLAEVRDQR